MPKYYKLVRGAHTRWEGTVVPDGKDKGKTIKAGAFVRYRADSDQDTMADLSAAEIKALGNRIVATDTAPKGAVAEEETPPTPLRQDRALTGLSSEDVEAFTELNAKDASELISSLENPNEVRQLRAVEAARDTPRKTVLDAADHQLEKINSGK